MKRAVWWAVLVLCVAVACAVIVATVVRAGVDTGCLEERVTRLEQIVTSDPEGQIYEVGRCD